MKLTNLGLLSRALAHFHLLLLLIDNGFPEDIRIPPEITRGPSKEIVFRDGETIRLDCVSKGHPMPWFEWKKDGKTVDPNDPLIQWLQPQVTGSIEIRQAGKARTGYYQCLARNGYGIAMSNVSFVQMAVLDRFPTTGIQSHQRTEGQDLVLPCHNLNSVPSPRFSWALVTSTDDKHPTPYAESDRVRIDGFGNLHFAYVKKDDERNHKLYKCQVFNDVLDITQGGSYANLSITARMPIPTSAPRPAFKTGSPLIGLVGGGVDMACYFYGNPVSRVTWQKLSGSLPPPPRWKLDPSSYNTEAHIDKLEMGDAGNYICTGTNTQNVSNSTITLQIEARPSLVVGANHLSSRNATEGETLTFTCLAEAIPSPAITWFRNGAVLQKDNLPPKYHLSADGLNLTISDLCKTCSDGSSDLAVIQCNASNVHGYVFAQGSINVLVKTKIRSQAVTTSWAPNLDVVFPCVATSDDLAPLSHKWFYNNQPLLNDSSIYFDEKQETLHIKTANDVNEDQRLLGIYKCIVTNGYSNASVEHTLIEKTTVVNNSVTVYWESEKEFLFPCFASFDDAVSATYTWFLNNETLIFSNSVWFDRNDSSLHVQTGSDLEEDGKLLGEYRCEVTNGYSRGFVQHHLLSPEDGNGDEGSILAIIIPIIIVLLIILAVGATLYGCRKAKKRRDKRCRDRRRSSSSSESEDKYESMCVDTVDHEAYTALANNNGQENGYEIPAN